MQASTLVVGLHRQEIHEFLLEQAQEEMKHIEVFKRLIIGLGGMPTCQTAKFIENLSDPYDILAEALRMEEEVVDNYVGRIDHAEELQANGGSDKVDGKYIELFLEEQILHSRADADHIKEMLL